MSLEDLKTVRLLIMQMQYDLERTIKRTEHDSPERWWLTESLNNFERAFICVERRIREKGKKHESDETE